MTKITLEEKARLIAERKAVLGLEGQDYVPVNTGRRRTPAKRQLLQTIDREVRASGVTPRFQAVIG